MNSRQSVGQRGVDRAQALEVALERAAEVDLAGEVAAVADPDGGAPSRAARRAEALEVVLHRLPADRAVGMGQAAELVRVLLAGLVLERVRVHRVEAEAALLGEPAQLRGALGLVPGNVQRHGRRRADQLEDAQFTETFEVGADGKSLANVFVYVKNGLGNYIYDTPTETARIDQDGCRYHPHVFGMRVGQPLEILNSDPTLHNIHATPKLNSEFNTGQPIEGMKTTHTFDKPEVMVPFKCDVHGWMNAYVGVLDHPYFAVTDKEGKFSLKTLPAGTYTIEAWHERLGAQEQMVTIGAKETKDVAFTFKAPAAEGAAAQ